MNSKLIGWMNGSFVPAENLAVSILDLGLIHCDATYDVLSVKNGRVLQFDQHLARFRNSCAGWKLPLDYTDEQIRHVITTLHKCADLKDSLVWLAVTRGIPESGFPRDLTKCGTKIFVYIKPYYGFNVTNTAKLCLASNIRVPSWAINQIYKNWAWQDLTQAQWEALDRGFDSAVLLNQDGFLTEGPGFNIAIINEQNQVLAPAENRLSGTRMELVRKLCSDNDIDFQYLDIDKSQIYSAADMFITSTAGDVVPVSQFEQRIFDVSPLQIQIQNLMDQAWNQDKFSTSI
jgi:branched-chain amino acid aminotransferase